MPLPRFKARFTKVLGPTGDVETGATQYFVLEDSVEVNLDGTVTFAINLGDGYSFDNGATWGAAPDGFQAIGSSITQDNSNIGAAIINAPRGPDSDALIQLDCSIFAVSPQIAHRHSLAGSTTVFTSWPDRLLSVFDLTAFIAATLHCFWDNAGGFGGHVSAVILKTFNISGDYVIVLPAWITKECTPPESHIRLQEDSPGPTWESYGSPAPTPVVDSVEPPSGTRGGGTPVTIRGSGFDDAATVTFGGLAADDVVVVSQYEIACTTPLAGSPDAHAPGLVDVVVTNSDGQESVP
jgi:IPT/TIG domain-containing protein